jgi:hypothetical protein
VIELGVCHLRKKERKKGKKDEKRSTSIGLELCFEPWKISLQMG